MSNLWDRIGEGFQAVGEVGIGTKKVIGGTATAVTGAALGVGAYVAEPVLYGGAKAVVGLAEGLDQGNVLRSEEEYSAIQDDTLAWPGWGDGVIGQFGQDVFQEGLTVTGEGAFGHGANAVELISGMDSNPQNELEFRQVMDDAYGTPSTGVKLAAGVLDPGKLGRVINIGGVVYDSTEWLRSRGVDLTPMTEEEYESILRSEITRSEINSLQSDVEEAEQAQTLTREQAFTYARILAGPDGWGAQGNSSRGVQAIRDAQQGLYQQVLTSWNAWRAAGGTWRNDV